MSETIPLFPLGTVLYPGLLLPLHIFEERYRELVRDLLDGPEPRRFGVVAIRKGRETGIDGVSALYDVGCAATLRRVERLDDGRYEIITVGTERFRLGGELDESRPYLRGEVDWLPEEAGDEAAAGLAVPAVQAAFRAYLEVLTRRGVAQLSLPDLPGDPLLLSYLVAASVVAELPERQALLAQPDALRRLEAERSLLVRETSMIGSLTSRPAPDLRNSPYSPN
jgi:Lon protease-like protein